MRNHYHFNLRREKNKLTVYQNIVSTKYGRLHISRGKSHINFIISCGMSQPIFIHVPKTNLYFLLCRWDHVFNGYSGLCFSVSASSHWENIAHQLFNACTEFKFQEQHSLEKNIPYFLICFLMLVILSSIDFLSFESSSSIIYALL